MTASTPLKYRIQSIDILRGIIMLVMAIDHTRDIFHTGAGNYDATNLATTTPILFFTRWITHFCAPNFVFLSGISAYLAGTRRTKSQLSGFLIKRGIWLVVVEVVIITLAFSLNPFYNVIIFQVIWAIGVSMIILGLLIWLPAWVIGALGLLLIVGHDVLLEIKLNPGSTGHLFMNLFFTAKGGLIALNQNHFIFDLYAVLPWTGVMLLGYFFGTWYQNGFKADTRKSVLLFSSAALLISFILLRLINHYGDPSGWHVQKSGIFTVMSFLNVSKYPPSLMYCCITLSIGLFILAVTEKVSGRLINFFKVYGSVPFFYYILHFYLIRIISVFVFFAQDFKTSQIVTPNSPFLFVPPGFGFNLGIVYLLWLAIILVLYFPCKWFSNYRKSHRQWWLSYL